MKTDTEIREIWSHSMECGSYQKLEEARKDSPMETGREWDLATPGFHTSDLQNCERRACCFETPSLWYFVMVAPGSFTTGKWRN